MQSYLVGYATCHILTDRVLQWLHLLLLWCPPYGFLVNTDRHRTVSQDHPWYRVDHNLYTANQHWYTVIVTYASMIAMYEIWWSPYKMSRVDDPSSSWVYPKIVRDHAKLATSMVNYPPSVNYTEIAYGWDLLYTSILPQHLATLRVPKSPGATHFQSPTKDNEA